MPHPSDVTPPSIAANPSDVTPPPEEPRLPEGTRAVISGLNGRPELNGTSCIVLGFQKERYGVVLPSGESLSLIHI